MITRGYSGDQDNGSDYTTSSSHEIINGFLNFGDKLNNLTGNFGYYSLKASIQGFGILGNSFLGNIGEGMKWVGYLSTTIKVGTTFYKS